MQRKKNNRDQKKSIKTQVNLVQAKSKQHEPEQEQQLDCENHWVKVESNCHHRGEKTIAICGKTTTMSESATSSVNM